MPRIDFTFLTIYAVLCCIMPYKRVGKTIMSKSTGRWRKKQSCKSIASAKRALKLLRGLEHGTIKRK